METENTNTQAEEIEGLDDTGLSWGDYPLDEVRIRHETRTVVDVMRRIERGFYVMDPEFQRAFIWPEDKQSKLIESVLMRIPLPVFYMAEDEEGHMIVVDGLQRLSTFRRFLKGELRLQLPERQDIHGKRFDKLAPKFQNRIEDCNLIFYIIDAKTPERACLDIFDRVNSGMELTRQQMRNSLYMGKATRFLKEEAQTRIFSEATGGSLKMKTGTMRDREFVNRFCAFRILGPEAYRRDDMDGFLAECLKTMNRFSDDELTRLSEAFRRGLANNLELFGKHAFRKRNLRQKQRSALNASFWDVMSTGLSYYPKERVESCAKSLCNETGVLLYKRAFKTAITDGPNDPRKVRTRFDMSREMFRKILGDPPKEILREGLSAQAD